MTNTNPMREALELARKRIEYLGSLFVIDNQKHQEANEKYFFPPIDAALAAQSPTLSQQERGEPKWLREAFDSDSIPKKNIALRMAHDEIKRLEAAPVADRAAIVEECASVKVEGDVEKQSDAANEFQEGYAVGYQDTVVRFRAAIRALADARDGK